MRLEDPAGAPLEPAVPQPAVEEQPVESPTRRRPHLVVVVTRALHQAGTGGESGALSERYWNPHEQRWSEADYESLESLRRRHVDEEGWELLQEQRLDAPLAVELIFKAHRIDFTRPSREQILRDIGMTPDDVDQLMEDVDRRQDQE
ncbi:MAG TPA: hypothetical protein VHG35_18955 [Gemmatimonadales bacterium]|nr:hypothetical protein [Gemmatimonadales bacterium]